MLAALADLGLRWILAQRSQHVPHLLHIDFLIALGVEVAEDLKKWVYLS